MKSQYALALLTLLPVLYVLSTGPVIMIEMRRNAPPLGIPSDGVLTFYKPLIWLGDRLPAVNFVVGHYVQLWLPRPASP